LIVDELRGLAPRGRYNTEIRPKVSPSQAPLT
jgi:hypothetical protein